MSSLSIAEIGKKLTKAGRLKMRPLCVYGAAVVPCESVAAAKVNRCLSEAVLEIALKHGMPPIHLGENMLEGVCPGGQSWLGYIPFHPHLKDFISVGSTEFRGGVAEYYKASREVAEKSMEAVGKLMPLGKYTIISGCDHLPFGASGVKAITCFGNAEQIRNLCGLIHFRSMRPFSSTIIPWGPACATMITYPAGIAEKAPDDTAFVGPTDPTGNAWFPESHLVIGIPIKIARQMCDDLDDSFIAKKPGLAYPRKSA
ncbi:MAG: DUF169 domain-containing protein [Methanomassiliicoccales archaeon]|jgi:hypothetical protein